MGIAYKYSIIKMVIMIYLIVDWSDYQKFSIILTENAHHNQHLQARAINEPVKSDTMTPTQSQRNLYAR